MTSLKTSTARGSDLFSHKHSSFTQQKKAIKHIKLSFEFKLTRCDSEKLILRVMFKQLELDKIKKRKLNDSHMTFIITLLAFLKLSMCC